MSDPTSQEPTMEEILASIRRIISEDEVPAEEGAEEAEAEPLKWGLYLILVFKQNKFFIISGMIYILKYVLI